DLSMPGMDGRELALRVRESTWSHLPILFLTGNLIESINRHVPSLEDCPVIGKPVNLSLLIAAVGRALNLAWVLPDAVPSHTDASGATPRTLPENERAALLSALESGEFRRLKDQLAVLRAARPDLEAVISPLAALAATYQLEALRRHLEHDHP
ncbi:response regulator, partial [Gluconacetobacter sacchari]